MARPKEADQDKTEEGNWVAQAPIKTGWLFFLPFPTNPTLCARSSLGWDRFAGWAGWANAFEEEATRLWEAAGPVGLSRCSDGVAVCTLAGGVMCCALLRVL